MKPENEILKDFYLLADYLEKKYKIKNVNKYKNNISAFLLHANHIKSYDFIAPFCMGKKVLDIGCFIGYGETRIFSQAKEIIAIDSDDDALDFARNRFIPNVRFEKADAKRLPFPKETFDIIIAFQLIEHIPFNEVGNFLSEVKKILKETKLF
ncbi:MAG TPA: class I SAM-dependent methyltransferase [bacterium]|nr:class I SAM-dependent methyltransferase [bacterium]